MCGVGVGDRHESSYGPSGSPQDDGRDAQDLRQLWDQHGELQRENPGLLTVYDMVKKFSHTRYGALGPEMIQLYRQSARWWLFKSSPAGRLPLLSARFAATFPAEERHCPLTGTKLYCLVTETHKCEQLVQGCYIALPTVRIEPTTYNDRKSNALPLSYCATSTRYDYNDDKDESDYSFSRYLHVS